MLRTMCVVGATVAIAVTVTHAGAPMLHMQWSVNGGRVNYGVPSAADMGNGLWAYDGEYIDPATGLRLCYSFTGNVQGGLDGNMYLFNELLESVAIAVDVTFPVGVTGAATTELQGVGVVGIATGLDGGQITSIEPWLWQTLVDGETVDLTTSLFFHPFLMGISGPGAAAAFADFGFPNPSPAPPVTESIGFRVMYTITSFDAASITSDVDIVSCPGDINDDGQVTSADLTMLLMEWGSCEPGSCDADLNGDGDVGTPDLLLLLDGWGTCPMGRVRVSAPHKDLL